MKTVTLETAKKLREAGFPQETHHKWIEGSNGQGVYFLDCDLRVIASHKGWDIVAAPTAEEVLDQLPAWIKMEDDEGQAYLIVEKYEDENNENCNYKVKYESAYAEYPEPSRLIDEDLWFVTLAEAAAKMWLYLKEHKLI